MSDEVTPEERAQQIRATIEWNGGISLPDPAVRYMADAITAAEREAFEAGWDYSTYARYYGTASRAYDDWRKEADDD